MFPAIMYVLHLENSKCRKSKTRISRLKNRPTETLQAINRAKLLFIFDAGFFFRVVEQKMQRR